ncbi:MAG: DUF1566 domain-containing protein, partial [Tidjanibacter sp.]|nr:DUF1566 domain-containing protein [Tidjanibacter sp.]
AKAASQTGNNKINTVCIHGKEGVILSLSDDGEHGKLISVEYHTVLNWKDSQKWYSDLGADWRLPSREELQTLKSLISQNEIDHSFTAIYGDADYFWTNEEHSKDKAWLVSLRNGSSYIQNKNFVCKVLVIYEF